jgi:hypothetical protein
MLRRCLSQLELLVNAQVDTFRESGDSLFVSSVANIENMLLILDPTNIESISNTIFITM